jgi:hypothetical protein
VCMCECSFFRFLFLIITHTKYSYTMSLSTNFENKSLINAEEEKKIDIQPFLSFLPGKSQALKIAFLLFFKSKMWNKINVLH